MLTDELLVTASNNISFFSKVNTANGQSFCRLFESLIECVDKIKPLLKEIEGFAADYDFDEKSPGNGYRSFVYICDLAVKRTLKLTVEVETKCENIFFRSSYYEK